MSLVCAVIGEYLRQYHVTVVLLNSVAHEPKSSTCNSPAISVLAFTNLTLLMDLVESGFQKRQKYLIVVTSSYLIQSVEFKVGMDHREALGFSRWIWRTNFEDSTGLVKFSRLFLCLSLFSNGSSSINVPADFVRCNRRRTLTSSSIKLIETFRDGVMTFVCQKFCADMPNRMVESNYMNSVVRYLNLTSWHVLRTDPNKTFEMQSLDELKFLRRRGADVSMTPSPITYGKMNTSSQSLPCYYFDSRLLSWRLETQTLGGEGMFGMLDISCWAAMTIFVLFQIVIFRRAYTAELSKAICLVAGILLCQPAREKRRFSWKLNAFFLYMAAFYLGAIFRNALISNLNVRVQAVIDTAKDLRTAMHKGKIERLSIPQFGHYMSAIGEGINKYGLLRVLDEAAASKTLYVSPQPRQCVDFWLEKRTHACFLVRPYEYLHSKFELASVHMSERTGQPVMIGRAHSPWHYKREKLNLLSLTIFESGTFYDFNRTVTSRSRSLAPGPSPATVLVLSDVNVAFITLGSTLFILSAYHAFVYVKHSFTGETFVRNSDPYETLPKPSSTHSVPQVVPFSSPKLRKVRSHLDGGGFDSRAKSRQQWNHFEYSPELKAMRDKSLRKVRRFERAFPRLNDDDYKRFDSRASTRSREDVAFTWNRLTPIK